MTAKMPVILDACSSLATDDTCSSPGMRRIAGLGWVGIGGRGTEFVRNFEFYLNFDPVGSQFGTGWSLAPMGGA